MILFDLACQKIVQYRSHASAQHRTPTSSRPSTPQGAGISNSMNSLTQHYAQHASHHNHDQNSLNVLSSPSKDFGLLSGSNDSNFQSSGNFTLPHRYHALSASSHQLPLRSSGEFKHQLHTSHGSPGKNWNNIQGISQQPSDRMSAPIAALSSLQLSPSVSNAKDAKELPTPSSTPTTSRKSRRRSNLFIPSSKKSDVKLSELGVGRGMLINNINFVLCFCQYSCVFRHMINKNIYEYQNSYFICSHSNQTRLFIQA